MEELKEKLTTSLAGVQFPASKSQLISNASAQGADADTVSFLDMIEDREYSSMDDVMTEMEMEEGQMGVEEVAELGETEEL